MPGSSSPSVQEDFKAYEDHLQHVTASLSIQVEFLQENTCTLLDIQQHLSWESHTPY